MKTCTLISGVGTSGVVKRASLVKVTDPMVILVRDSTEHAVFHEPLELRVHAVQVGPDLPRDEEQRAAARALVERFDAVKSGFG